MELSLVFTIAAVILALIGLVWGIRSFGEFRRPRSQRRFGR